MSIATELEKLETLRRAGTLTEAEFAAAKRRLLAGEGAAPKSSRSVADWRFLVVGAAAVMALGLLGWQALAPEAGDGSPALSGAAAFVLALCILLLRPFGHGLFGFGFGFGGEEPAAIPLFAALGLGAAVVAGGLLLVGLPLVALGLAALAVIGFVVWAWESLFGD